MKKVLCRSLVLALGIALVASAAYAKRGGGLSGYQRTIATSPRTSDITANGLMPATAALTTTELYAQKFDLSGACNTGTWTKVDETAQVDQFWHVTDFTTYLGADPEGRAVLDGAQSLWCGAEKEPVSLTCGYLTIPGYGNSWVQTWQTKSCLVVDDQAVVAAVVNSGGTGYVAGDVITLAGGTFATAAELTVLTLSGPSAVATVSITTPGNYSVVPGNPVAQGSTTGVGTGATFDVTFNGTLDATFMIECDSEESYDATYLEYTTDCTGPTFTGWTEIDGGFGIWDGIKAPAVHAAAYGGVPPSVKVRLRFEADGGWSDEDGLWDSTTGPVVIDDLGVEALTLEDFEGEALGAESTADWEGYNIPGYGQYMALYSGLTLLQQDECDKDLSCQWAAISGSLETYACGGFPGQIAVPKGNGQNQYVWDSVESPTIAMIGTGSVVDLQFTVYFDMPLDNLVFYTFGASSINGVGCVGPFRDRNFVYYGDTKSYGQVVFPIGDLVAGGTAMKVRMGANDMCGVWCGVRGTGSCHSHAPLFDNVRIYRVDIFGPTYSNRDLENFQDTFPTDGTDSGTGRADAAVSWQADASVTNIPADSFTVICLDPITRFPAEVGGDPITGDRSGLAPDVALGGWQIYMWVRVVDSGVDAANPGPKAGVSLQQLPRNPYKDDQVAGGKTWTRIRMDRANNSASRWRIDLPDALFEAGDVVYHFIGATSTSGSTSYLSGNALTFAQSDKDVAAGLATEFSILPMVPGSGGSDILYVDGMDGRGAQVFWDASFAAMGLTPDRYDIKAPSSSVGNHIGSRCSNVTDQLNANYQKILFDCGNLTNIVSDGNSATDKSDDYKLINSFLGSLTPGNPGGVYIGGDDIAENLAVMAGGEAAIFKSLYITYNVTGGSAFLLGYGVAPTVIGMPAGAGGQGAFAGDSWLAYGGCPAINDFDVLEPTSETVMQSTYGAAGVDNGADISQNGTAADPGDDNRVLLSGYAFQFIKDDAMAGETDRNDHLYDILIYLGNNPDQPTDAKPVAINELEQNYPNPFNPQTTIAFSIKDRARVKIDVYNVAGQLVKTLLDETRGAGSYTDVRWDGTNGANQPVSSGVYFYKLVTNNFSQTKKMVLLK